VSHRLSDETVLGAATLRVSGCGVWVWTFRYCVPEIGCTSQTLAGGASPAPTVCYTRGGWRINRAPREGSGWWTLRVSGCGVWVLAFQYCVPEIGCRPQTLAGGASSAPTKCCTTRKSRLPSVTASMRSKQIERKWRVTSRPNRRAGCIRSVSPMRENRAGQAPPLPSVTRHEKAGFPLSPHRWEAIRSNGSDEWRASQTLEQAAFGPFRPCEKTGRGKPRPYDQDGIQGDEQAPPLRCGTRRVAPGE